VLSRCTDATRALFAKRFTKGDEAPREDSRKVSETSPEDSRNISETFPTLPRAGAREEANGKRPKANGNRLTARRENARNGFDTFWAAFPKKVGKDAAWRAWQKRRPDAGLLAQMIAALDWQCRQDGWLREGGRYVPNPATWLNAGRWQDEQTHTQQLSDHTLAMGRTAEEFLK
jgi:hypothetical protein